jgi:hypothetical protein
MTLQEIKTAINQGKQVFWKSQGYQVIKDSINQYLIKCIYNGHCIGLTWTDGVTMNGEEADFFTA